MAGEKAPDHIPVKSVVLTLDCVSIEKAPDHMPIEKDHISNTHPHWEISLCYIPVMTKVTEILPLDCIPVETPPDCIPIRLQAAIIMPEKKNKAK